jgi:hypothetical protein
MKLVITAAATTILATTALAGAQPTLPEPSTYVMTGVTAGADAVLDWFYTGVDLEGGVRLSPTWWLHGEGNLVGRTGYGAINQGLTVVAPEDPVYGVRVGPEARVCDADGLTCVVAGVDVGYRTGMLQGVVVVPRGALEIGGDHLRFRIGVEASIGDTPHDPDADLNLPDPGIGATAGIGYQW